MSIKKSPLRRFQERMDRAIAREALVKAAPDMLATLESVAVILESYAGSNSDTWHGRLLEKVNKSIAKAKGKS